MKGLKKKYTNSYLFKLFTYFMMTFIVSVLTIICLNMQSQMLVKEQVLLSNQKISEQVFQLLDAMAKEMEETCLRIAMLDQAAEYAEKAADDTDKAFERLLLMYQLQAYSKEKFGDIFIYYPQDDRIVSSVHGGLAAMDYYDIYYKNFEVPYGEFQAVLNCESGIPAYYAMSTQREADFLCVAMRYKFSRKDTWYTVGVMLDRDYLHELLSSMEGHGGCILIFDKNRKLILAGSRQAVNYNMEDYTGKSLPYATSFDGMKYIMSVSEMKVLRGYYAYAIPSEYIWKQLFDMRLFSIAGIIFCFVTGLFLVVLFSRKAYKPLGEMLVRMEKKENIKKYDSGKNSEFEFLTELFINEIEEKNRLYSEVRRNRLRMRDRSVLKLLEGSSFGELRENDMPEENGLILCSDLFAAGVLLLEKEDNMDTFILRNVFEELFNRYGKGYVLQLERVKCVFLLNLSVGAGERHIAQLLEEGKRFLENNYGIKMTMGYSRVHEGVQEIQVAYREAQNAVRYYYLLGKGRIIPYSLIENREFDYLNSGRMNFSAMLDDYLEKSTQPDSVSEFVADICDTYRISENSSLENVECFRFDVISGVNMVSLKYAISEQIRKKNLEELLARETLEEFEAFLVQVLLMIRQKKLEQKNDGSIGSACRQYIEENYANEQLSLSMICEAMNISMSYLAKLYKEKNGISVAQDITRIRLLHAKQLLKDTDLNVNKIAESTGFSNSNVFIKVFKKWEGITPGRYRELCLQVIKED